MSQRVDRSSAAATALAARRRRIVLACLPDDGSVGFDALTDAVVELERQADDAADLDSENVALSLHHVHLPTLDAVGYVEYDPQNKDVAPAGIPDGVEATIENWTTT